MNTIQAVETDIFLQVPYMHKIKLQKPLSEKNQRQIIFCGSGDSFAAALLVEAFSNFRVRAADPLDLIRNKSILKNNILYIVSISGNTITNVNVAKNAKNSTVITLNNKSKLAKICSNRILLNYPSSGVFTAGTIGFLSSALTGISLVSKFKIPNMMELLNRALIESKKIKLGKKIFILGNLYTFPIAMYCAAKFYEMLGITAQYERIEQFLHMGLFSVKKGDTIIIFEEKNFHNIKIMKNLKKLGINVYRPASGTKNKIAQVIFFTLISQLVPLFYAKKHRQKECFFVTAKNLRNASSRMIY